jgi:hypothetical protein
MNPALFREGLASFKLAACLIHAWCMLEMLQTVNGLWLSRNSELVIPSSPQQLIWIARTSSKLLRTYANAFELCRSYVIWNLKLYPPFKLYNV